MAVVQKQTRHCILTAFVRSHIASNMQVIILKEASPAGFLSADEELWAIGVGSCISHGHNARSRVLQSEVLICKLVAVDGLSTGSIVIREIPTLESHNSDSALINKLNGLMRRYLKKTKKHKHTIQISLSCRRNRPDLAHEPWDDTVEARTLVAKTLLSGAQGSEVLCIEDVSKKHLFLKAMFKLPHRRNKSQKENSPAVLGTTSALNWGETKRKN